MSAERDTQLSRGFDAGNYCNAYETEDFTKAIATHDLKIHGKAYIAGFVLGFFSSYELHEIPSTHYDRFIEAYESEEGQRILEFGYCDPR